MSSQKLLVILLLITLFGFLLRVWKLTSSPSGLYIDETSIGYNAFSIITTGRDEHGKFMPLFFEAFGEYKLPIYIYLVAITQLFTGPTDLSVRLPAVIFGILTIPLIYLFLRELLRNDSNRTIKNFVPYLSAFLLAISPWHFQFSRPGFEASTGLFFLLLGLFLFYKSLKQNSLLPLVISFIAFVLTLYSYNSSRIVTPVLLLVIIASYFKYFSVKNWLFTISIALLITLPFIFFSFSSKGLARAKQVSIFYNQNEKPKMLELMSNYWSNISPVYLFKNGDPTIAHSSPYRMSLLHIFELPFVVLGFFYLLRFFSKKTVLLLILIFVGFLPPAIASLNPHALRALFALPGLIIVSSFGLSYFLSFISTARFRQIAGISFIFLILLSFLNFLRIYHLNYAPNAGWDWQVGIKRASQQILRIENNYSDIYFDVDPRLIPVVWYLKIDPGLYQESINKNHIGKFHINENISSKHGLYVGSLLLPRGKLLEYVYYPNNSVAYGIWEF